MGAISGALGGIVGKGIGVATKGMGLSTQMLINSLASGGMSVGVQLAFTGKVDPTKVGVAATAGIFAPFGVLKPFITPAKDLFLLLLYNT